MLVATCYNVRMDDLIIIINCITILALSASIAIFLLTD
tara:strand:+ start:288 stop:401 length:114 start_codon:yes stop_codon:yes gene_type:complete